MQLQSTKTSRSITVKSEVENSLCYILTSMETDEITPLHFAVRYFINILAKNINLVIQSSEQFWQL